MPGTKAGAAKAAATIKEKYGKDHYKTIGKLGQASYNSIPKDKRKPRGFAANLDLARRAGKKGGTISRRNRKEEDGQ